MCGRFTRYLSWSEIVRLYRLTAPAETGRNDAPAYNVAPTDPVPFITAGENGPHKLREGRWWLVPWWAKEMPKAAMFNARSETLDTSGAFKDAFASTRCLIPADGYYEWTKSPADGGKDPWHIFLPGHQAFSFAGLWAHNKKLDITSCTIITAVAAGDPRSRGLRCLARSGDAGGCGERPAIGGPRRRAAVHRVSRTVNSVKNQGGDCIEPVNPL